MDLIRIPLELIKVELTCPICLGLLRNTLTTMECLHRFCGECITTALRLGKKECPTCRLKCPSKRSLRRDHKYDEMVSSFFPHAGPGDPSHQSPLWKSVNGSREEDEEEEEQGAVPKERRSSMIDIDMEVSIRLIPRKENTPCLEKSYLRTSKDCTIHHIALYVKMMLERQKQMEPCMDRYVILEIENEEELQELQYEDSLSQLMDKMNTKSLNLFYQIDSTRMDPGSLL